MKTYPIPFNEEARLRALFAIPGLTEDNAALFEAICDATRKLLACPIAHISIVEDDTQWYKATVGMDLDRMPKDNSFCAHTIMSQDPMIIPDLSVEPRFKRHPMVSEGGPEARYYAGVPLILSSGLRFGSLCALDLVPHERPSEQQIDILVDLGKAVVAALESTPVAPKQVVEDDTAKTTFLTLVGHELRTPLTILSGSLQLLDAMVQNGPNPKLTRAARKSVDHLIKLVETIISFSDVATGELRLNETVCDLGEILEEISDLSLPGADGIVKSISIHGASIQNYLYLDPEQIKLAISALVLNAINHGGSQVVLSTDRDMDGNIEISITDNGNFDQHVELAELYKPFVVGGDINYRDTRGGLGLGLPLTRKLVELHGGAFEVRPTEECTTAVIRLPAWRADANAGAPPAAPGPIETSPFV